MEMSKHPRLQRRGAVYWFRCRIPADLVGHYGKKEILRSLKTRDAREAVRLVRRVSEEQEREFDRIRAARTQKDFTSELTESLASAWIAHRLGADEESRYEGMDEELFDLQTAEREGDEAEARRALASGNRKVIDSRMEDYLTGLGYVVPDKKSEAYKALSHAFLKANVRAVLAMRARDAGDEVATPPAVIRPDGVRVPHTPGRTTSGTEPRLSALLGYWQNQGDKKAAKTLQEAQATVRRFKELHGDLPLPTIERRHIVALRDALAQKSLAPATIKKQLGLLRSMFQIAIEDERFGLKANPGDAVKVRGETGERKQRAAFTPEELTTIFAAPIFAQGERPKGGGGEAAYWIPLVALYTGARLNEIGQLRLDDLQESEGIKFFRFTDTGAGQALKVRSARRRVPVHPELLRFGLWDYAARLRQAGEQRLFPSLKADSHGHLTGRWSKWWNRYQDKIIGIDDPSRDFHSFRHTFKHHARACGIAEDVHDALTGHANATVARTYGGAEGYPLRPLAEAMERLRYELPPRKP